VEICSILLFSSSLQGTALPHQHKHSASFVLLLLLLLMLLSYPFLDQLAESASIFVCVCADLWSKQASFFITKPTLLPGSKQFTKNGYSCGCFGFNFGFYIFASQDKVITTLKSQNCLGLFFTVPSEFFCLFVF